MYNFSIVRCQMDNDDEVRDRATYFRAILDKQEAALNSMYILNGMQVPPSRLPSLQCCASKMNSYKLRS
jgi:hypothetical protein